MHHKQNKIIIVDEAGFSQVCSSILRKEGFKAESLAYSDHLRAGDYMHDTALVITSYPYGKAVISKLKGLTMPVIVLSDHVGREIIDILEGLDNSYCMVKPINYSQFTSLVKMIMSDNLIRFGGYCIV
jgi:DNA-binding response OmpR family regulator